MSGTYPCHVRAAFVQHRMRLRVDQTEQLHRLDTIREALETDRAAQQRVHLGAETVQVAVLRGVAIRKALQREAGQKVKRARRRHQVTAAGDLHHLAAAQVLGRRQGVEKGTAWRPRELVAQRIVGALGGRQTAAVAEERLNDAAALLHVADALEREEVIDARIQADLVQQRDARLARLLVLLAHRVGHIAGRHQVRARLDAVPGDQAVQCVRQQRNDDVRIGTQLRQRVCVLGDVQIGALDARIALGQPVGLLLQVRAHINVDLRVAVQVLDDRCGYHAGAQDEDAFLSVGAALGLMAGLSAGGSG